MNCRIVKNNQKGINNILSVDYLDKMLNKFYVVKTVHLEGIEEYV